MKYDSRIYWTDPNNIGGAATGVGAAALQGFANPLTDVTAGVGLAQTIAGLVGIGKTPDRVAPSIDPKVSAMVDEAIRMGKQGFSPESIALYKNNTAMGDTARFQHGIDTAGGSLGKALAAGNSINDSAANNTFAAKDQALRDAHTHYANESIKYLQGLENKDWMENENFRKGLNTAWGGAAQKGLSTLTGALEAGAAGYGKNPDGTPKTSVAGIGSANDLGLGNIPKSSDAANFNFVS